VPWATSGVRFGEVTSSRRGRPAAAGLLRCQRPPDDATDPLHVVATDIMTGQDVLLSSGNADDAILDSAPIPGVLPPVRIEGQALIEGGVGNNAPLPRGRPRGRHTLRARRQYSCALGHPRRGALGVALQAASLIIHRRLILDMQHYTGAIDLRVVPPLCPITVGATDFSQADYLIRRAHDRTRTWLEHRDIGTSARARGAQSRARPRSGLRSASGAPSPTLRDVDAALRWQ